MPEIMHVVYCWNQNNVFIAWCQMSRELPWKASQQCTEGFESERSAQGGWGLIPSIPPIRNNFYNKLPPLSMDIIFISEDTGVSLWNRTRAPILNLKWKYGSRNKLSHKVIGHRLWVLCYWYLYIVQ